VRDGVVEAEVELTRRDLRIGRGTDNDVVLDEPSRSVSRHHAELRYEAGRYVLIDLNSQNGTWVGGHSIRQVDFHAGVSALVGPYSLVFDGGGAAPAAPPRGAADRGGERAGQARTAERAAPAARNRSARVRPPASPTAPQGAGPVAWLARQSKPKVFGGFILFMALLLTALNLLSSRPQEPAAKSASTRSNDEVVAGLLAEGRALLARGDATAALERSERALIVKPEDAQALELKMRAQEELRRGPAAGRPEAPR